MYFLKHIIHQIVDEDEVQEINDFFSDTENFSFEEARREFDEDEFSDEEIRILRANYISKIGN